MDISNWQTWFIWAVQAGVTFCLSAFLFDALHYLLHIWRDSRVPLLRKFAEMHWIHHEFLDKNMQINEKKIWPNIFAHILPEFLTGAAGTLIFLLIFPWQPIVLVLIIRVIMLGMTLREEGLDANHMRMDRVSGQQNAVWVNAPYHAMHHIYPNSYFSSFLNVFDFLFGKSCEFKQRKFVITGASGAYGTALKSALERDGAEVKTLKHGQDFTAHDVSSAREMLAWADVIVLSHGAKSEQCMDANFQSFVALIEAAIEEGQHKLVPPEIWALGSEAELHGTFGDPEMIDYVASKRAFAAKALDYYHSNQLIYRHIVPSSFTSQMGKGPISANTAVAISLFLIKRGFRYVPVTTTSLALWNYFRFRFFQNKSASTDPATT